MGNDERRVRYEVVCEEVPAAGRRADMVLNEQKRSEVWCTGSLEALQCCARAPAALLGISSSSAAG